MANLTDNKARPTEFSRVNAGEFVEFTLNSKTPDESGRYFLFTDGSNLKFWNGSSITTLDSGGGGGATGGLDSAYSIDRTISVDEGAVALTDATAGSANTLELIKTGVGSGNVLDLSIDAALTGNAVALDMNLGIAAIGLYIDAGAGARTGADIRVNDDSTGAHSVIDINSSGAGATIGFDFVGSYNGNAGGQVFLVDLNANDNLTTEIMQVTTGAGARDIMFDLNFGHTDSGITSHIFDIDVTAILDSNIFDFATSVACTGDVLHLVMDNALAGTALHIESSGARTQPLVEIIGTQTGAADMIDISADGAFTGDVIAIDMNAAVGANALFLDAGAGTRTAPMVLITFDGDGTTTGGTLFDINVSNSGAAANPLIDIDVSAVYTGAIFDVAFGAAATGAVINVDLNLGLAAPFAVIDAGNGIRTADIIDLTFDGSGNVGFLDVTHSNTGSGNFFDIDVTGVHAGKILSIVYSGAATGDAVEIDMTSAVAAKAGIYTGAGARTDDLFEINDASTGNAHIWDVNMSGIYTGNVLDITYASGAATGNAIDLNMGTNVAGMAISIGSAATGTANEGACFDVAHTGDLVANADVVRISSTGNISSTSNLLSLVQSTGAGSAGAYALHISATGTNVEAIKVDDGAVVFDETLTVTGAATFSLGYQATETARTATVDGLTTGTIADGTSFVTVTSADANYIIILPTPTPGTVVWLRNAGTGYELRSDTPASVAINGGIGASAESAIGANVLVRCVCTTATTWIASQFSTVGTESAVEAAA